MAIVVKPLGPVFGAEMLGADVKSPSQELTDAVNRAMMKYVVLVIRDQFLTDEEQIRFSRGYGPLELPPAMGMAHPYQPRIHPKMYDVSNLDKQGNFLPPEDLRHIGNRANEEFHTDSSFNALPTKWSLLSARIVPPEGADTIFADTRAAWDALPEATRKRIKDAVAEHYFWKTRSRAGYKDITDEMTRHFPPVQHKMVRVIPESGRTALYIGNHATHIIGWPLEEGQKLLDELNAFATQPQFLYTHKWRPGDFVLWDNRCTLHRATKYDVFKYKRDLRRTTVNEHGPETSSTEALGIASSG